MNTDHLTRQLDLIDLKHLDREINVIGAGAIGSFVALSLAKMGFYNLHVWDFDQVSVENMNCQFYRVKDIGKSKVKALHDLIEDFTEIKIIKNEYKWDGAPLAGIVITAVDSMEVRRKVWEHCKQNYNVTMYIDPRMAAEYALSFVMSPHDERDIKAYETTLYTDANAVQERCTAKATMYTVTMIAGYVAKHVKDLVCQKPYARVTHWNIEENTMTNWKKIET